MAIIMEITVNILQKKGNYNVNSCYSDKESTKGFYMSGLFTKDNKATRFQYAMAYIFSLLN